MKVVGVKSFHLGNSDLFECLGRKWHEGAVSTQQDQSRCLPMLKSSTSASCCCVKGSPAPWQARQGACRQGGCLGRPCCPCIIRAGAGRAVRASKRRGAAHARRLRRAPAMGPRDGPPRWAPAKGPREGPPRWAPAMGPRDGPPRWARTARPRTGGRLWGLVGAEQVRRSRVRHERLELRARTAVSRTGMRCGRAAYGGCPATPFAARMLLGGCPATPLGDAGGRPWRMP